MPLVLDPDSWTPARLLHQIDEHCKAFDQLATALSNRREGSTNPFALDAGIALLRHSAECARMLVPAVTGDRRLLAVMLNQMYETMIALPYLVRAAGEPPKVPPSRKPPPM